MNFTFFRGFGEFKTYQHIQLYLHTIVIDLFNLHAGIRINKHTHQLYCSMYLVVTCIIFLYAGTTSY